MSFGGGFLRRIRAPLEGRRVEAARSAPPPAVRATDDRSYDLEAEYRRLLARVRHLERENKRLRHFRDIAYEDVLTGLPNRRYLQARLDQEIARSRRTGRPLAIAMIDIDHFKATNDRFGHQAGDRALRALARYLSAGLRAADVVCRYGGEEFVALFPETDAAAAAHTVDRLRRGLIAAGALDRDGLPQDLVLGFSAGVAEFGAARSTAQDLIRDADRGLYEAKRQGRGRVVAAPCLDPERSRAASPPAPALTRPESARDASA